MQCELPLNMQTSVSCMGRHSMHSCCCIHAYDMSSCYVSFVIVKFTSAFVSKGRNAQVDEEGCLHAVKFTNDAAWTTTM